MNISKNQVVLIAIGAVTVVAAGVLGFLAYGAYAEKSENAETLETATANVRRLLRAEVSPDNASVLAIKQNCDAVAGWAEAALSTASAGDRAIRENVNEAAFKQQLVDEARVLAKLPGGVDGAIVKPDFTFGFNSYIAGGELPAKDKLPMLQRQWGDVRLLVETLAKCGVIEIVRIEPTAVAAAAATPAVKETKKKDRKRAKDGEDEAPAFTSERYGIDFRARPAALVKVVNALATSDRFIVVEAFDFAREGDMIMASLGGEEKAAAQQQTSSRRRRRPNAEAEPAAASSEEESKKGIVNDPEMESPFLVKMVVTTFDFGSAAKAPAESAKAEDAEAAVEEAAAPEAAPEPAAEAPAEEKPAEEKPATEESAAPAVAAAEPVQEKEAAE